MARPAHRAAFITGASSGIGAALASHLAARGLKLALAARREDALAEVVERIERSGGEATAFPLDVTDHEAVRATMLEADDRLGGIDLVVANAGVARGRWSGKLEYRHCHNVIEVNVRGTTATLTALLPRLLERKRGHLVGISSVAQYGGLPKFAAYSGSKAYLSNFLETMRMDLRGTGIAVTDIRPGYIRTEMTGDAKPPFLMEADDAAARMWRAIERRRPVLTFPLPMALLMRTLAVMPTGLYDRLVKKIGV